MARYRFAPEAAHDIEHIGASLESPAAARRLMADFFAAFALLADMPSLGHIREDLTARPVRFWTIRKRYLVVYRTIETEVEIARVLDGHRDVENILG